MAGIVLRNAWIRARALLTPVESKLFTRGFQTGAPSAGGGRTRIEPISCNYRKGQEVKWCACGYSKSQPHCDGSHIKSGTGKTPIAFMVPETKSYSMCVCKKSLKKPFCDDRTCHKI